MFPLRDNIALSRVPLVTIAIVIVNVIAYLLAIRHGGSFFGGPSPSVALHYGAIPYELTHPGEHCGAAGTFAGEASKSLVACVSTPRIRAASPGSQPATWITPFTSMFVGGSFLQIFGNVLALVLFGPSVEDAMSRPRFLAFYLLGGLAALALAVAVAPNSTAPLLGASGAVGAVLGGYLLLHPRARVITLVFMIFFFTIVELPSLALLGLWGLAQVWFGLAGLAGPLGGSEGIGYFAHILGGFLFGVLAFRAFASRRPLRPGTGPAATLA